MWMTFFSAPRTPWVAFALRRSTQSSPTSLDLKNAKPYSCKVHIFTENRNGLEKKMRDKINFLSFSFFAMKLKKTMTGPSVCLKKKKKRKKEKKKKDKSSTEALHTKWPAKICNSKQWDLNLQNKLVARKYLTIPAN